MSAAGPASSQRENESTIEQGATPLELFFDLVFTQVMSFLSDHLTWAGMLQGER
jgi:low temperature requirement protein LtrA